MWRLMWQTGLAVFLVTLLGLTLLGVLLSLIGLHSVPPFIHLAVSFVISLTAGLAVAIQRAARFRRTIAKLSRPAASVPAEAGDVAPAVLETVTVVLRRQVPPRFGEPPRSWLGGLPRLPEGVDWPRSVSCEYPERGERPLHFAAQICCADLPPDLWGGLGPRRGWLVLFIDPNQGGPEGPDAFRILHTEALGSERVPPADLGPVHDGVYTGWDYEYCGGAAFVPRVWRRWPVDLVAMPNEARIEGRNVRVAPPDLAQRLYGGAPVAEDGVRPPAPAPFTRRGVLYALNAALHGGPRTPGRLSETLVAKLNEPGCLEAMRALLESRRGRLLQRLAEHQAEHLAAGLSASAPGGRGGALEQEIVRLDALLSFLSTHPTPAALIDSFQDAQGRLNEWQADRRARLERLRDAWREGDPESAVTEADWARLRAEAEGEPYHAIAVRGSHYRATDPADPPAPIDLFHDERRLRVEPGRGMAQLVADYYVDPARRQLIPAPLLPDLEASWRRLVENRPHRMGGYHDGVQSDAAIGPAEHLLLFQLASDEAMHWCWGDVGAYYIYIRPADLQRGDFDAASIVLECR